MTVVRSVLFQAGNGNHKYMGRVLANKPDAFSPYQKQALQKIISDLKPQKALLYRQIISLQYRVISTLCDDHSTIRKISDMQGLRETLFSFLSVREIVKMRKLNRFFHKDASDICMLKFQRQMQTHAIAFSDLELYSKVFHSSPAKVLGFQSELARELTSLDFSNSGVTRQELDAIAPVCPKVSAVNFSFCFRITNTAIFALPHNWPQLTSIDVSGCSQLIDRTIVSLAAHYPHLTSLSLLSCEKISDATMRSLAEHCKELKKLNVSGCTKLKENSVLNIIHHCPSLENFEFDHNIQSDEVLRAIAQMLPSLRLNEGHKNRAIQKLECFKNEMSAIATSPLGRLYQNVLRNGPAVEIQNKLRQLPRALLNQIYTYVWEFSGRPETEDENWGEIHVLDDNKILYRTVKKTVMESFEKLHPLDKAALNPKGNLVKLADDIRLLE